MRIIVDAMGGDHAPEVPVEAAVKAANTLDIDIVLVGDENRLKSELLKYAYPSDKITIVHSDDVITNYDEPAMAVKSRKTASVVVCANLLKDGEGDAMLSMGSTGALLAAGLLIVGRIKGISRPALATLIPTKKGPAMLMDAGANTACKPENLVQFGIMGDIYMKNVLGIKRPKVGLVSNGEEEGKGNDLTKEAYPLMKKADFNFVGNIEGRDIMAGETDVIVCDGFVGNVILKTIEGMGIVVASLLKQIFLKNVITKIGALLVRKGVSDFKKMLDYSEYGGAPLLGTKKPIIKGHGSSNVKAVYSALIQAKKFVETNVIEDIKNSILEGNIND
ncbi:MAG: phosphate acyltransferase PlsX [Clostridia bacterium]|nr:phosphate acyltransferase PlsX [Clostridia bacterium]